MLWRWEILEFMYLRFGKFENNVTDDFEGDLIDDYG